MVNLRVFISSPGDVLDERNLARRLLSDELPRVPAFRGRVTFDPITWDDPASQVAMLAAEEPQDSVNRELPRPADCDFVVVILWSRMGTPLPSTKRKPGGECYLSGTEWEYEDALNSPKKPRTLVYWRTEKKKVDLDDPELADKQKQLESVKHFLTRFQNPDGSLAGGFNTYAEPVEFKAKLRQHLEQLVWERIREEEDEPVGGQPPPEPRLPPVKIARVPWGALMVAVAMGLLIVINNLNEESSKGIFAMTIGVALVVLLLFIAAEFDVSPTMHALAVRWLLPRKGEIKVSTAEAFTHLFEAVFGDRHLSAYCFVRSAIASSLGIVLDAAFPQSRGFGRICLSHGLRHN